ncbi:hypothetical protein [Pseudarthrobacter sp. NamE5]|uniref:hypothetical protein n=1 Tax=Pseudarthrobacter sp. NamE5 TaxID=2576839 RepID=UPI001F0F06F8|nr:hypothetical protein [Pseudarthrobacter sp. NamE5]
MFELVPPNVAFHQSFLESHREWAGVHQDGAAVFMAKDVTSSEGFADWVGKLLDAESAPEKVALFRARTFGSRRAHAT